MKGKKGLYRAGALAVGLALTVSVAAASGYADLEPTHWAYAEMSRAAELGIVKGVGEGRLAPAGELSWGQFLTMFTRTFAPEDYRRAADSGLPWDQAGYSAAMAAGLLRVEDRDFVDGGTLGAVVRRQDAALLLERAMPPVDTPPTTGAQVLADFAAMEPRHQRAVARLYDAEIMRGRGDGSFGGDEALRRADGSVLILRALDWTDPGPAVDAFAPGPVAPPPELPVQPEASVAPGYVPFRDRDARLVALDENAQKHALLFGDPGTRRFASREAAAAGMEEITVPVWKLSGGVKSSGTLTLEVHHAVAREVEAIFAEIYSDPEQFPLWNVQGFRWQEGAKGEHNCGTAIDLNWEQNYQIRDGAILAGKLWEPGVNPYSIGPDSSVVRAFEAHGWSWGGDAWAHDSNAAYGYHDYMHFSYLGG